MMEITYSLSSHWSVFYLGKILVWVVLIYSMSLWEVMSLLHPCVFVGKCRLMSCKDYLFMWLQYWTGQNLRLFAHAITTSWMIFLFMNSIEFLILFFFLFSFLIKISEHMMLLSFSFVEDANATCVYCYQLTTS